MVIPPARDGEDHDARHDAAQPKIRGAAIAKKQAGDQECSDQSGPTATRSRNCVTLAFTWMVHQTAAARVPGCNSGQQAREECSESDC